MPFGLRKSVLCGALALQKQLGDLAKVLEFEVCLPGVLAWCACLVCFAIGHVEDPVTCPARFPVLGPCCTHLRQQNIF